MYLYLSWIFFGFTSKLLKQIYYWLVITAAVTTVDEADCSKDFFQLQNKVINIEFTIRKVGMFLWNIQRPVWNRNYNISIYFRNIFEKLGSLSFAMFLLNKSFATVFFFGSHLAETCSFSLYILLCEHID